jgi:hypothetical protein
MSDIFNRTGATSVGETQQDNCGIMERLSQTKSQGMPEFSRATMPDLELHVYSHCYGD